MALLPSGGELFALIERASADERAARCCAEVVDVYAYDGGVVEVWWCVAEAPPEAQNDPEYKLLLDMYGAAIAAAGGGGGGGAVSAFANAIVDLTEASHRTEMVSPMPRKRPTSRSTTIADSSTVESISASFWCRPKRASR